MSEYKRLTEDYKYPWKYTQEERPCDSYGCCYDCGMKYGEFPDMVLADELWEKISPSQHQGGGLLCPTCIANRLDHIGLWYDLMMNDRYRRYGEKDKEQLAKAKAEGRLVESAEVIDVGAEGWAAGYGQCSSCGNGLSLKFKGYCSKCGAKIGGEER